MSETRYVVTGDKWSGHGLPVGAVVTRTTGPEWSTGGGVEWYTQGGDGDEVAIDPRDIRGVGR